MTTLLEKRDSQILNITHTDADGIASGFIVRMRYPNAHMITTNYGKQIDPAWLTYDVTIVTDFSFDSVDALKQLGTKTELHYIDHHDQIDKLGDYAPLGLRNKEHSAAYLTWQYLFPNRPVPKVIQYISDYDTWNWVTNGNMNALYFHYGLSVAAFKTDKRSERMFSDMIANDDLVDRIVGNGMWIHDYIQHHHETVVKDGAFITYLAGHKAVACNIKNVNSLLFDAMKLDNKEIPLRILFSYFANINKYRVSVFSVDPTISASDICAVFSGGGHAGAAGFTCTTLPFVTPDYPSFDFANQPYPDNPMAIDIFHPLKCEIDREDIVRAYVSSGSSPLMYSHAFPSRIEDYSACCVNNPTGLAEGFTMTGLNLRYDIGVFYFLTNTGKYRYRIYVLNPKITLKEVSEKIPGSKIVDNSVCFIGPKPPVRL